MSERERVESVMDVVQDLESSGEAGIVVARIYKELFFTSGKFLVSQLEGVPITVRNPGTLKAIAVSGCPDYDIDSTKAHLQIFGQTAEGEVRRRTEKLRDAIYSRSHVSVDLLAANAQLAVGRIRNEGLISLGAILLGSTFSDPNEDSVQIFYPRVFKEISPIEDRTGFAVSMASLFLSAAL